MSKRDDSSPGSKTSTLQVSESLASKEKDYTSILDTSSRESGISSGKKRQTDRQTGSGTKCLKNQRCDVMKISDYPSNFFGFFPTFPLIFLNV